MAIIWKDTDKVPELFLKAMKRDGHVTAGDVSITELLHPVQEKHLKLHNDIIESAPDRLWALVGTAIHHLLEEAAAGERGDILSLMEAADVLDKMYNENKDKRFAAASQWLKSVIKTITPVESHLIVEETLVAEIDGVKISGKYDIRDTRINRIEDYKNTKAWAYTYKEQKEEWDWQLNGYRWLAWKNNIQVDSLRIWGLFRDWDEMSVFRNNAYPRYPVMPVDIRVKPLEEVEAFFRERVRMVKQAASGIVTPCNGKDRWATGDLYKVKSPQLVKAIAVYDNPEEANKRLLKEQLKNPKIFIDFIAGENKRCARYCPVRHVCPQWKKIQEEAEKAKQK